MSSSLRARSVAIGLVLTAAVGLAGCRAGSMEPSTTGGPSAATGDAAAIASVESLLDQVDRVLASADAAMQDPQP